MVKTNCNQYGITEIQKRAALYLVKEEIIYEEEKVDFDESAIGVNDLLAMIQALPDRYRLVFNLYVLDCFSHKEIA